MTPREQVVAVDVKAAFNDAMQLMVDNGFSRVPVYSKDPENIVGILHIKELFTALCEGRSLKGIKSLIEEPYFVPETKRIPSLLRSFQNKKTHMAIVISEYGGLEGIVTLEDLLEELVGEIYDEFDQDTADIRQISPKEYIVKGECEIEKLNHDTTVHIPKSDDYQTIAGYVMQKLGRLPNKGDKIVLKKRSIVVLRATDTQVQSVKIKLR
jgi:putative hemolysin